MSKYFTKQELACKHCGSQNFDEQFLTVLDSMREACDFPFIISSAYRCPEHPIEARKSKLGEHTTGMAVDIVVNRAQAHKVLVEAVKHDIQRIGFQQKGDGRFIHLGCSPEFPSPTVWSY